MYGLDLGTGTMGLFAVLLCFYAVMLADSISKYRKSSAKENWEQREARKNLRITSALFIFLLITTVGMILQSAIMAALSAISFVPCFVIMYKSVPPVRVWNKADSGNIVRKRTELGLFTRKLRYFIWIDATVCDRKIWEFNKRCSVSEQEYNSLNIGDLFRLQEGMK